MDTYVQEVEEPSRLMTDSKQKLVAKEQGVLPGFRVASSSDYQLQRYFGLIVVFIIVISSFQMVGEPLPHKCTLEKVG